MADAAEYQDGIVSKKRTYRRVENSSMQGNLHGGSGSGETAAKKRLPSRIDSKTHQSQSVFMSSAQERGPRPVSSVVSMTSEPSRNRTVHLAGDYTETGVHLEKSDSPNSQLDESVFPEDSLSVHGDGRRSPVPSVISMKSDQSMTTPMTFAGEGTSWERGNVLCSFCPGRAFKSCLTCVASFCEPHVRQHYKVPALQIHQLVEATGDPEQRLCPLHHRELEFYCRTDQTPVCAMCVSRHHSGHEITEGGDNESLQLNKPQGASQIEVPAPEHLFVDSVTATTAHLCWRVSRVMGQTPHSFLISYHIKGTEPSTEPLVISSDSCSTVITGLKPAAEYIVNVCTKTQHGGQSQLSEMTFRTASQRLNPNMKQSKPSSAHGGKRRKEEDQKKGTCRDLGLNLVLCGSNAAAKASVAALILGLGHKAAPNQVRVKGEAEVCGRHVTLVQLPSLANTQFSIEDVLAVQQCVRLCDSGVDAFLLVVPQRPLSDEDKEELKRMEHFFGDIVRSYCQIVVTGEGEKDTEGIEDIVKAGEGVTEIPKVSYILGKDPKVQQLLEKVENMRKQIVPVCYTADMYITAQLRMHLIYHNQLDENSKLRGCNQGLEEMTGDLRIVLLGKTGQGKSASGNTILGGSKFVDHLAPSSVTTVCQKEIAMVNGRQITVVDTPGLFDTVCDPEVTKREIKKCVAMAAPGPHVFLLVIALGRFTEEEREAVKITQEMFGEESDQYTLVLFTRGDDLQGQPLDKYLEHDLNIKALLQKCGNRCHLFNNRDKSSNDQVPKLLDMIDTMLRVNGGKCYTSEMFQKAEEALKQRQDRILQEREEQIKKEKEELQAKHEAAMEKLKQEMEEERRRREEERGRREKDIKCKEQSMKKAMKKLEEEERCKRCTMEEEYKERKKQNEDWLKQRTEEIQLEKQRQQEEWEKNIQEEQRKRKEEEEERREREREREREWQDKQMKEKEKFDNEKKIMKKKAEEEKKKNQQEYEDRVKQEKEKRRDLEEKIKHAEKSKVQQLEKQKRKHEEECQRRSEEEKKRIEEEKDFWRKCVESKEQNWVQKQEQLKQEKEKYEKKLLAEKQQRDVEDKMRRKREKEEKRKIEQDAALKMKEKELEMRKIQQDYAEMLKEQERKSAEMQKQKSDMEEQLRQQREQFKEEKETDAKANEERQRRNIEVLIGTHKREKDLLKRETEMAARRQAEEEFNKELDRQVKEARTQGHAEGHQEGKEEGEIVGHKKGYDMGHEEGKNKVEAERTRVGKCVDVVGCAVSELLN